MLLWELEPNLRDYGDRGWHCNLWTHSPNAWVSAIYRKTMMHRGFKSFWWLIVTIMLKRWCIVVSPDTSCTRVSSGRARTPRSLWRCLLMTLRLNCFLHIYKGIGFFRPRIIITIKDLHILPCGYKNSNFYLHWPQTSVRLNGRLGTSVGGTPPFPSLSILSLPLLEFLQLCHLEEHMREPPLQHHQKYISKVSNKKWQVPAQTRKLIWFYFSISYHFQISKGA